MNLSISLVLCVELVFAIWLASTICLLRPAFTRALRGMQEHPSSEAAAAEFGRQQFLSEMTPFVFGACVFGVLALPTVGMAALRHRRSARRLPRRDHASTPAASS